MSRGVEDGNLLIKRLLEVDRGALAPDGRPSYNRLIFETSPYLLQHAENPVDWYGWRDEAFAAAREGDKPIILSIGYATCHWCHVMEHESFEDEEVAEVMNRHFIAIKVDREERPDIDEQYMLVAQMMTGSGGWPLNIIMTPDRRPFFAATYMPKHRKGGMPGLIEFLEKVALIWRTNRDAIEGNCRAVMEGLENYTAPRPGNLPGDEVADEAVRHLATMYDTQLGGFGSAPKFPMATYLTFLLVHGKQKKNALAVAMAEQTLLKMRDGGIYDQLGFGYHRYSVDRLWIVPHFEKMLYDQALLTMAYLEAFQATGNRFYSEVAEEILTFTVRELKQPGGGFYSALDADSEGEEGTFYVWSQEEIQSILGVEDAGAFSKIYSVTGAGNFEGKNILHINRDELSEVSQAMGGIEALGQKLEEWREALLAVREKRIRPLRDEKILTSWNGLTIAAAARGYAVTGNKTWLAAAVEAATFIRRELRRDDGRLLRSHHGAASGIPAFLEDYASYVYGLIELHQATLDRQWLEEALDLARQMLDLFDDPGSGGLFDTGRDAEAGLVRMKSSSDGVMPSANSMAAQSLIRLGRIAGDDDLIRQGERIVRGFMGIVEKQPVNHLQLLVAADMAATEEVLTLTGRRAEVEAFLRERARRYRPMLVVRYEESDEPASAQLCAAGKCGLPLQTPEAMGRELYAPSPRPSPTEGRGSKPG